MIDLKVVAIADPAQHRAEDRLVNVVDPLAARAYEVMVVLGYAGDVRGDVARSLQPRGHASLDLRLQGAVNGRETQTRMTAVKPLVELLR